MKYRNLFSTGLFIVATSALLLISCKKNDDNAGVTTEDAAVAQDDALADNTFSDIQSIGDQAYSNYADKTKSAFAGSDSSMLPPSASIAIDTVSNIKTITIDFGTAGYTCGDGRVRKGKILISFNGPYRKKGTVITHTTDGYEVNGNKVNCTKVVTNEGWGNYEPAKYVGGYIKYSIEIEGQIIKTSGDTITWESSRTRKWLYGYLTPKWRDDVYALSGTVNGKRANGVTYTTTIQEDLVKPLIYKCIIKGVIEINTSKGKVITIDYGNGDWKDITTWDNKATVTVNGKVKEITL